jgi:chromosome segregation ATPase
MSDPIETPVQQAEAPEQQVNWEARYRGASQVINRLNQEKEQLVREISQLTSELEQLKAQLSAKDREALDKVKASESKLSEFEATIAQLREENAKLKAKLVKVQKAKEIGAPELVELVDALPDLPDERQVETVMKAVADLLDKAVKRREQQLTTGVVPKAAPTSSPTPSSNEEWMAYINSLPLGSKERTKAMEDWWQWGLQNPT